MKQVFFLDDNHHRLKAFLNWINNLKEEIEVTHAFSATEAYFKLPKKEWDTIFLDHDLGSVDSSDLNTGYRVALFIKRNKILYHQLIIHSQNVVGASNIKCILDDAIIMPFSDLIKS